MAAIEAVAAAAATAAILATPTPFILSAFGASVDGFIQRRDDVLQERVMTTSRITRVRSKSVVDNGSTGGVDGASVPISSEDGPAMRKRDAMAIAHECGLIGTGTDEGVGGCSIHVGATCGSVQSNINMTSPNNTKLHKQHNKNHTRSKTNNNNTNTNINKHIK
jgi:hypothetical protein